MGELYSKFVMLFERVRLLVLDLAVRVEIIVLPEPDDKISKMDAYLANVFSSIFKALARYSTVSIAFICQEIETSLRRYLLIVSYLILFIPQFTTFFLYIYSSSFYMQWIETDISKRLYRK
jgi:hypothetical protein